MPTPQSSSFFSCFEQVLFTNTAVVHSFLGEMDPGFVVCLDFDRLGDANQAFKVAKVLAPNETVAEMLARSFVGAMEGHVSRDGVELLPYLSEDMVVERLQRKLDSFESVYCK